MDPSPRALGTTIFAIRLGIAPDRKVADSVEILLLPFRKAQEKVVDEVLERRQCRQLM